jgi:hypothetical protein
MFDDPSSSNAPSVGANTVQLSLAKSSSRPAASIATHKVENPSVEHAISVMVEHAPLSAAAVEFVVVVVVVVAVSSALTVTLERNDNDKMRAVDAATTAVEAAWWC